MMVVSSRAQVRLIGFYSCSRSSFGNGVMISLFTLYGIAIEMLLT